VSSAITTVDVVRTHDRPGELLGKEIQLVRRFRATEHSEALMSVLLHETPKFTCGVVKSFIPTGGTKLPLFPNQGICQSIFHRVIHGSLHWVATWISSGASPSRESFRLRTLPSFDSVTADDRADREPNSIPPILQTSRIFPESPMTFSRNHQHIASMFKRKCSTIGRKNGGVIYKKP